MTYSINGTELLLQPTREDWLASESLGRDGMGHNVYPGVRQFKIEWQLSFPSGTAQLQDFFEQFHVTGTAVVSLPRYNYPTYEFFSYSGCVIDEPTFESYFSEYQVNVSLLISNIRT